MYYLNHFFAIWLTPPGCFILLSLLGLLFWKYKPILGKWCVLLSVAGLWLFSTPFAAQWLINGLQYQYPALNPKQLTANQANTAIVVLDAGINTLTPEYGEPNVAQPTLARLRYAAFLHQKTHLPILVSGNYPLTPEINDAEQMGKALQNYFGVKTRWYEDKGNNTAEEALYIARILKNEGITQIYLVTHALHMPRSVYAFQDRGLNTIPAPTGYILINHHLGKVSALLPSMEALHVSYQALHEYIGLLWYRCLKF